MSQLLQANGVMKEIDPDGLRASIEARLKPVCADWPEPLFAAVVSQIVAITVKYDRSGVTPITYDQAATERMISGLKLLADQSANFRAEKFPRKDS